MTGQHFAEHEPTNTALVTIAETVVCTLAGISTGDPSQRVFLRGFAQVTPGTATTGLTARIRRGTTIAGTLVGEANLEIVAGAVASTEDTSITGEDTPGEVASQSYVLTVQQAAATGNGTVVAASLEADLL